MLQILLAFEERIFPSYAHNVCLYSAIYEAIGTSRNELEERHN